MTAWFVLAAVLLAVVVVAALGVYEFFVYRWLRDHWQWGDDHE